MDSGSYPSQRRYVFDPLVHTVSTPLQRLPLRFCPHLTLAYSIFPIHTMTPVWVFPAYPLLITAPLAGNLINSSVKVGHTSTLNALPIAMAAVAVQGMGFCLSFMILAAFIYRLMTQKLPRDMQRPGVFISIGPSGFTAAGLGEFQGHHTHPPFIDTIDQADQSSSAVQLGGLAGEILPDDFMMPGMTSHAVFILKLLSAMIGLWLWGLALWSVLPCSYRRLDPPADAPGPGSSSYPLVASGSTLGQNTKPRSDSR